MVTFFLFFPDVELVSDNFSDVCMFTSIFLSMTSQKNFLNESGKVKLMQQFAACGFLCSQIASKSKPK